MIIGAATMAAGHFMMAFEPLFYFALATIAVGNGLFLPSLPSQINDLYGPDDPRRGWAYNVYYVGVNIGGFLAPLDLRDAGRSSTAGTGDSARRASACWRASPSTSPGSAICRRTSRGDDAPAVDRATGGAAAIPSCCCSPSASR